MSDQTWFIDLDLKLDSPVSEALLDDLIEAVEPLHGAVSPGMEMPTLGLSLAVEALDAWDASELARKFLEVDLGSIVPNLEICSLRILNEDTREAENEAPTFPPLVAVPDIADMLGVSRQQAHRLSNREGFPAPALEPRTGPLWIRAAVESWNERTERQAGRPTKRPIEECMPVGDVIGKAEFDWTGVAKAVSDARATALKKASNDTSKPRTIRG